MAINNETYFEFDDDLNEGFTTIPNYILNDIRLTYKAVGVYVQILQYRNTGKHKVYLKSLAKYRKDRNTAVSTGLKELEQCGYISREYLRNEKGQMQGMKYIVRMKPIATTVENTTNEPKSENQISDNPISDFTTLKIKSFKKENGFKKENNVVDVVADSSQPVIKLYKTFKLEKRVMPHTTKLLKQYSDKLDLEVFEQIFIDASSDNINNKYRYIKEVIETLVSKNIRTLQQYEDDRKKHKESKSGTKGSKTKSPKPLTRFHNIRNRCEEYTEEELMETIIASQKAKYGKCAIPEEVPTKDYRALAVKELQKRMIVKVEDNSLWKDMIDEEVEKLKALDLCI